MIAFREPVTVRFDADTPVGSFSLAFHDEEGREMFEIQRSYPEVEGIFYLLYRELFRKVLAYVHDADAADMLAHFRETDILGSFNMHPDAHTLYYERSESDFSGWLPIDGFRASVLRLTFDATTEPKTVDLHIGAVLLLMLALAREIRTARRLSQDRDRREHPEDFQD